MSRWKVDVPPDRAGDASKVAVIWSLTRLSKTQLDQQGELVISDGRGLRAFDLTGREIPAVDGQIILPFTQVPVYVTNSSSDSINRR